MSWSGMIYHLDHLGLYPGKSASTALCNEVVCFKSLSSHLRVSYGIGDIIVQPHILKRCMCQETLGLEAPDPYARRA